MELLSLLMESGLNKEYTLKELFSEMEKEGLIILPDGTKNPHGMPNRHREYVEYS